MIIPEYINDKATNIHAFREGYFGNTLGTWDTLEEFLLSDEPNAAIRCKDSKGGGGFCRYIIARDQLQAEVQDLVQQGYKVSDMYFNANPPHDGQILQFEYLHRSEQGCIVEPHMLYTFVNEPMRPALAKQSIHMKGHLACRSLIRQYMTDPSWTAFLEAVNRWPTHVLEVSCFNTNIGVVPGHNSIIWEIRNY